MIMNKPDYCTPEAWDNVKDPVMCLICCKENIPDDCKIIIDCRKCDDLVNDKQIEHA